ncbi:MAG TPA: hypothetical protein DHV16_05550 [Nitrospiraceae bacterium]|nr:MAG: hypothetical protein A2Z82_03460 [Nitrospirae bacterium GWA2_46_11]OGW24371.1 MAG: hypothetical protein A2X55_00265 [Nitrospirae bacterium GWB2_47_37]HAK88381.1 hypothetical protein [Nitrospiraceae bacterium]HCZ11712.1 hypothetical protein [Nitrospiraceae bacterium]
MAILKQEDLSLEIRYKGFQDGWVEYEFFYCWQGESVINDAILKRSNEYWGSRSPGAMLANEHRECGILPLLKKVLQINQPDYWESLDPDVTIAIYPEQHFPFLESKWKVVLEKDEVKQKRIEREKEKTEKGLLPDDYIDIILFFDVYNFKGASAYYGDGICFKMTVTRAQLTRFYEDFKKEYIHFKQKYAVDEFNKEDYGEDWQPLEL